MKKLLLVAGATALLATSCLEKTRIVSEVSDDFFTSSENADSIGFHVQNDVDWLKSYRGGSQARQVINDNIVQLVFGDDYAGLSVPEASKKSVEDKGSVYREEVAAMLEDFKQYAAEDPDFTIPVYAFSWESITFGEFLDDWGDYLNYMVSTSDYTGGAHGLETAVPYVMNAATGELVKEGDIFLPDYDAPVSELITAALRESRVDYESFEEEFIVPNGHFILSDDGVSWFYQAYEIAPYAAGIIVADVSWDDLQPYLKPGVRK